MKKTVFTLIAVLVLGTSTTYAQKYGGRRDAGVSSSLQHNAQNGNYKGNNGRKENNMHSPGANNNQNTVHHPSPAPQPAPAPHPAPAIHRPSHYPTPVVHHPAPVIVEPAPHPAHVVHSSITPAGLVAGAVIGTVVGALLCQ